MVLLFKILGLFIIFSVCVALGFRKSYSVSKRAKLLSSTHSSLTLLAEYIRSGRGEISKLLPLAFGEDFVSVKRNEMTFKKDFFESADIDLLTQLFTGLGFSDKNSEYERTKLFASLIEKQSKEAKLKAESLCKLYSTTGLLMGVFLIIFFL